jgi:hypothetical protein
LFEVSRAQGGILRTLILIADGLLKSTGKLLIQVLALYLMLALGMIVTAVYATRKIWQAKTPRPVPVATRASN